MATMTASVRGTPSFTPTPTQNTAPVHEFRCLFTHDAHKKAKKWHDGSVRFHTFNRRVMVYDEGKHYIGDHHYRQDDEFDEGAELRLDRGILVDVGERLGETQTDLAPILDRRKEDASPQQARNIRLVAAASQQQPKKLTQILGTRGRIGRARPMLSPYQQRQALTPVQPTETPMPPPAKRQKVDPHGKENRYTSSKLALQDVEEQAPKRTTPVDLKQPSHQSARAREPSVDFQDVLDLSSDEEAAASVPKQPTKTSMKASQKEKRIQKPQGSPKQEAEPLKKTTAPISGQRTRFKAPRVVQGSIQIQTMIPQQSGQRPEQCPSRSKASQPSTSSRPGTTQLRLRSQKPRRKLLYRSLLPSSKAEPELSAARSPRAKVDDDPGPPPETGEQRLDDSPGPSDRSPGLKSTRRRGSIDEPIDVPSSPLFVPANTEAESPTRSLRYSQDDLEARMVERPTMPTKDNPSPHVDAGPSFSPPLFSARSEPEVPLARSTPGPLPSNEREILPPFLPQTSAMQDATSPQPRRRSFRRVRSESDAFEEAEEDFPDLTGFSVASPSFLALAQAYPARTFRSPHKSQAKLRRTASESAVMEEGDERVTCYNIEPIPKSMTETGPWTATEAYLLFDLWPPGKNKPDYGVLVTTELSTSVAGLGRPTITTARDMMLRDDVNVL
jgi:Protein of unknown function (DUF2439)